MISTYRALLAGFLIVGIAAISVGPREVAAQDTKKDAKKDVKKDDVKKRLVGFGTSDGLALKGYFFQGVAIEKQKPDAVIMVPAPGSKIDDAWIGLAIALSEKNFSVLLFDWRGCGMNGPDGSGPAVIEDKQKFWDEPYSRLLTTTGKKENATIDRYGLDHKSLVVKSDSRGRYRDFMYMNDLLAARFYLDKQNDGGRCNTNRVWIVSEKEGAHLGMAFIAAEFQRNTIYNPKANVFDLAGQFEPAGKDYVGIIALSYATSGDAARIFRNALPSVGANARVRSAKEHLSDRLAMVLMNKKGDSQAAKNLLVSVGAPSAEDALKAKFKYPKEFDIKARVSGIGMIDAADSFKVRDYVITAMVEISKKQPFGKDFTDREAAKMITVPRFAAEMFNK
jgi:hypothetical protein